MLSCGIFDCLAIVCKYIVYTVLYFLQTSITCQSRETLAWKYPNFVSRMGPMPAGGKVMMKGKRASCFDQWQYIKTMSDQRVDAEQVIYSLTFGSKIDTFGLGKKIERRAIIHAVENMIWVIQYGQGFDCVFLNYLIN